MLSHDTLFRLADQFVGLEPDDIVDRMKQHNDAGSESYRCWEASRLARDLAEAGREFALGRAAQVRLAIDFGAPRGWRWTQFVFGLRTLAEGKRHAIGQLFRSRDKYPIANDFHAQFNHPYYYLRDRSGHVTANSALYGALRASGALLFGEEWDYSVFTDTKSPTEATPKWKNTAQQMIPIKLDHGLAAGT